MLSIQGRCHGAFIGHAIASKYDPSISMAIDISNSLLERQQFDGPDILSRYLFLYHTKHYEIGEATKYLYQVASKNIQAVGNKSSIARQDLLFDQNTINEYVKITNDKLGGHTAGCGPAQRSFPLALCTWIDDDDLFEISKQEAALTHFSPLAGQVAGVVNVICRSLLRNKTWTDAVRRAFASPGLHSDVINVYARYARSPEPFTKIHVAYAPTVLNAALYYIHTATNAKEAIDSVVCSTDRYYCAPIVGFLSGARWGIPDEMYKDKVNDTQFVTIRDTANKISSSWPIKYQSVSN
jgi:ADP-ribosylglycohydrolase